MLCTHVIILTHSQHRIVSSMRNQHPPTSSCPNTDQSRCWGLPLVTHAPAGAADLALRWRCRSAAAAACCARVRGGTGIAGDPPPPAQRLAPGTRSQWSRPAGTGSSSWWWTRTCRRSAASALQLANVVQSLLEPEAGVTNKTGTHADIHFSMYDCGQVETGRQSQDISMRQCREQLRTGSR
jgi:hypothetical protein